jgi:hypothetical protein
MIAGSQWQPFRMEICHDMCGALGADPGKAIDALFFVANRKHLRTGMAGTLQQAESRTANILALISDNTAIRSHNNVVSRETRESVMVCSI